jgi:ATP-dependent DNA ligase
MPQKRIEMPLGEAGNIGNIGTADLPPQANREPVESQQCPILIRPMLAKIFNPSRFSPCYVQPKLNGIRALAQAGTLVSRDGHAWNPGVLPHIEHALERLPDDLVFDGELYCHGMSLQEINKRVAVKRLDAHKDCMVISYNIFDVVGLEPYSERYLQLLTLLRDTVHPLAIVPTFFAKNAAIADALFNRFKRGGYEGSMHRVPHDPYSLPHVCTNKENRSLSLLKRKSWQDLDGEILDVIEGEGKHLGMVGSLLVRWNGITFYAGSGLSDEERIAFWNSPPIGHEVKIQYEVLSDTGIPLKPVILLIS